MGFGGTGGGMESSRSYVGMAVRRVLSWLSGSFCFLGLVGRPGSSAISREESRGNVPVGPELWCCDPTVGDKPLRCSVDEVTGGIRCR